MYGRVLVRNYAVVFCYSQVVGRSPEYIKTSESLSQVLLGYLVAIWYKTEALKLII